MMRQYDLVERVRKYNPNVDEDLLNRAYVYAMKAHGEQKRASGDPYFSHPLEVAAILTDHKLDDATIAAALLHDTIEDTEATRAEIDQMFGPDIGTLVEGLTKLKKLDLVSREAKQAENLRKLLLAIAADVRVLLVKLADRLHNMRTLGHMQIDKRKRIAEETLDIYGPLAARIGMYEMREELENLAFRELNPDAHRVVSQKLDEMAAINKDLIGEIEQQLARNFQTGLDVLRTVEVRVVDQTFPADGRARLFKINAHHNFHFIRKFFLQFAQARRVFQCGFLIVNGTRPDDHEQPRIFAVENADDAIARLRHEIIHAFGRGRERPQRLRRKQRHNFFYMKILRAIHEENCSKLLREQKSNVRAGENKKAAFKRMRLVKRNLLP